MHFLKMLYAWLIKFFVYFEWQKEKNKQSTQDLRSKKIRVYIMEIKNKNRMVQ